MMPTQVPAPLTPAQIQCVIDLLECRELAPKETAVKFYELAKAGFFTEAQQEALEMLFALDDDEIPDALLEFADEDARDIVRHGLAHEARMRYVRA